MFHADSPFIDHPNDGSKIPDNNHRHTRHNNDASQDPDHNKSTYAIKQKHFNELQHQVERLHDSLGEFDSLIEVTATQFKAMQRLALMHGSLFMASNTIFGKDNPNQQEEDEEEQQQDEN